MSELHLTKIAFGCDSFDDLRTRLADRIERGEPIRLTTRYKPKQADELAGGSLYWICKHRFGIRQPLLGFDEDAQGHCVILLAPDLIEVQPRPKRAHQGWRYLKAADAPPDMLAHGDTGGHIPAALQAELAELGLI